MTARDRTAARMMEFLRAKRRRQRERRTPPPAAVRRMRDPSVGDARVVFR